jgi:hypothetical protein
MALSTFSSDMPGTAASRPTGLTVFWGTRSAADDGRRPAQSSRGGRMAISSGGGDAKVAAGAQSAEASSIRRIGFEDAGHGGVRGPRSWATASRGVRR